MKLLVLGANGMMGHKAYQIFTESGFDTYGIMRQNISTFKQFNLFDKDKIVDGIDVTNSETLSKAFEKIKPDAVVNAIGVVKQICSEFSPAAELNSLFPHQIARLCTIHGAKLVHMSTDCVFSGNKGYYTEKDLPDADDVYGRTKLMGEVIYGGHLTIRTSIIGRELFTNHGLVEWFLSQTGEVNGYTKAIFSGLSTAELSRIIIKLIDKKIEGLLNVGTDKIDKFSLLNIVKHEFCREDITINPYEKFSCDRSLDITTMRKLGTSTKSYREMIREMVNDPLYVKGKVFK
jgi:dTDP-4-dehydrorhamnose reductase